MTFSVPVSVSLSSVEVVSSDGSSSPVEGSSFIEVFSSPEGFFSVEVVSSVGLSSEIPSSGVSSIGVSSVGVSSVGVSSTGSSFGFFLNPAVIFSQNFLNFLFIFPRNLLFSFSAFSLAFFAASSSFPASGVNGVS